MACQAQADGIAAVCATPHIRHDHDVAIEELPARLAELSAAVRAAGCRTRILPGGEVAAMVLDELDDRDLSAVALGGSARWILLEPAPGPLDHRLQTAVLSLRTRGFRALVAHPERHLAPDLAERLSDLVGLGALVQVTGAAVTDEITRPGMIELARAGWFMCSEAMPTRRESVGRWRSPARSRCYGRSLPCANTWLGLPAPHHERLWRAGTCTRRSRSCWLALWRSRIARPPEERAPRSRRASPSRAHAEGS